jgi:hypothetical protein
MRKWMSAAMVALAIAVAPGCAWTRSIDQWKCDKLGICWFGTQPSQENVYMTAPMQAVPSCCVEGCAPVQGMTP